MRGNLLLLAVLARTFARVLLAMPVKQLPEMAPLRSVPGFLLPSDTEILHWCAKHKMPNRVELKEPPLETVRAVVDRLMVMQPAQQMQLLSEMLLSRPKLASASSKTGTRKRLPENVAKCTA